MTHFRNVCEYGKTHGQCRCPSMDKITNRVICDNPAHIPEKEENDD